VRNSLSIVLLAIGLVTLTSTLQAQTDPWIGTWKVNLAQSTYNPGPTPKVAATVKIEPAPGGIKTSIDSADPQGKPTHTETVGAFDGKDNPVTGAAAANSTSALTRIDARTVQNQAKVGGKPTVTTRFTVSADGKTLTATQSGQNAQGQAVKNVIVLDRQ
jgi:hypothetical protein